MERGLNEKARVEVVAGAIAEELCAKYGDTRDPGQVARWALEAYQQLITMHPTPGTEAPYGTT